MSTNNTQKTKTNVFIDNQKYTIIGDTSPSHIRECAAMVDKQMIEYTRLNPSLDITRRAVLTAVNFANDLVLAQREIDELQQKMEFLETQLERLKQ